MKNNSLVREINSRVYRNKYKFRPYSGVDVTKKLFPGKRSVWMQWLRTFMGFKPSPFNCCKMFAITLDVIRGNRFDDSNPFKWDHGVRAKS